MGGMKTVRQPQRRCRCSCLCRCMFFCCHRDPELIEGEGSRSIHHSLQPDSQLTRPAPGGVPNPTEQKSPQRNKCHYLDRYAYSLDRYNDKAAAMLPDQTCTMAVSNRQVEPTK